MCIALISRICRFGDRLFGTYRDTETFAAHCGFPRHNERKLGRMLLFRDVYKD